MRSLPEPASPFWHSYRQRSRLWRWPAAADIGAEPTSTTLAPHLHADAHEIFVVGRGTAELTVGRDVYVLATGEVAVVPPGAYHALERGSDDDVEVFALVAPNDAIEPFVFDGFPPAAFDAVPSALFATDGPAGHRFGADGLDLRVVDVRAGDRSAWRTPPDGEVAVVVVRGEPDLEVDRLRARHVPGQHVTVPPDCEVAIVAGPASPARCLVVEARRLPAFCTTAEERS